MPLEPVNLALLVRDIAERDGVRRANLLARRLDLAIRHLDVVRVSRRDFLLNLALLDSLHAVGAFLHHAAHAHRHVRVLRELDQVPLGIKFAVFFLAVVQPRNAAPGGILVPAHQFPLAVGTLVAGMERAVVQVVVVVEKGPRLPLAILNTKRPAVVVVVVEPTHLVRAVVRAVTGANAAVVGHEVQPLLIMHRGVHRADTLARRILAVLAGNTLIAHLRVVLIPREIAVDPNPRHLPANGNLMLADNRDVVLALAGHHAGVAADTGAQVDHHPPLLALGIHQPRPVALAAEVVFVRRRGEIRPAFLPLVTRTLLGDVRRVMGAVQVEVIDEILVAAEVVGVALAYDRSAIHDALLLRAGHFLRLGRFNQLGSTGKVRPARGPRPIGVESCHATDPANPAPVTKRHADDVVGHAGQQPNRPFHGLAVHLEPVNFLVKPAGVGFEPKTPRKTATLFVELLKIEQVGRLFAQQLAGGLVAHQQHVVPSDACDRVRRLEQPSVVAPAAVVHAVVTIKSNLVIPLDRRLRRLGPSVPRSTRHIPVIPPALHRARASGEESVVQELLPFSVA